MTERRPAGSFPPDSALNGFDAGASAGASLPATPPPAPVPPAATSLVTRVDDLQKPTSHQAAAPVAAATPALPTSPRRVPPVATLPTPAPASNQTGATADANNADATANASGNTAATAAAVAPSPTVVAAGVASPRGVSAASARLADFGLAAIAGGLLFFVWRTRRRAPQQPAAAA